MFSAPSGVIVEQITAEFGMRPRLDADVLNLPARGVLGELEHTWLNCGPQWLQHDRYVLDMSGCTSFDAAGLIYILSRLTQRRRQGLQTLLRLPDSSRALDLLTRWRFQQAATDLLDIPFDQLALPNGSTIGRPQPARSWTSLATLPTQLFPIETFYLDSSEFGHTLTAHQVERWRSGHISAVLRKQLSSAALQIGTHIIHEAYSLASRSTAGIMQTAAEYGTPTAVGRRSLVIVFWDDGDSVLDRVSVPGGGTASEIVPPIERGGPLKIAERTEPLDERVSTLVATVSGSSDPSVYSGLRTLGNTVRDIFRGEVSFRTQNQVITLGVRKNQVQTYPEQSLDICGNILIIAIPLTV
ncbi:hypothetical protein E1293_31795 [Actinomadura darangshiensis]|uniref:STAS domain-containing protein n=1 Tax=Actinomadura darangshiensis TaxID=705336 RepID=A0A4R5AQF5_9ACTN|nr:hypothetical protein [Actinomadura darangshiensis]TDD73284.1 hypothetical protein E1293_31795 [Actinomadura darangshiensis]